MNISCSNPTDSRQIIEDYLHQIAVEGASYRGSVTDVGKKLDSYLFKTKQDLDPIFRDLLGEYTDPAERVFGTVQHIYTSAISGKLLDQFSLLKNQHGQRYAYDVVEHSSLVEQLQHQIRTKRPPAGKDIATLQKELDELRAYVPLDKQMRYGKLSGKMVSRFVRDQLASFDSPWGLLDGSIMRSLARFHNVIKIGRTALNPVTVVRNIMAMPILMSIAGTNPFTAVPRAFRAIRDDPRQLKEMLVNGILNVDQVRGEFLRDLDLVKMLNVDETITGMVKKGVNRALDFYRWPDMIVRAGTYLDAKTKFAKELGLPETHAAVIAKARDWTNRYTVNYANVAPLVKTLRQVPFTNLFISYTAEITRISKNLLQDVFHHPNPGQRVHALTALGGLASIPLILETAAEANLSEKDRSEWERARKLMPAYNRTKNLIVLNREKDGRFRYLDITPITQIDPIAQLVRAVAAGDTEAVKAVNPIFGWENTPAINLISEQITGEDLRTGRAIDKNFITRAKAIIDDIAPPVMPGGYEFRRVSEAFTPTEEGDLGITNARTGRRTTPAEIVSSYLTGMRMSTVDANKLHQFAIAEAKRRLANEAAFLRDVVMTNQGPKSKERATIRYRQAQENILLDLTERLAQ